MVARWGSQWRLRGAKKRLAKAETELGLLGWQQAEFDPQTQLEVDKILMTEREQARLTNESAALALAITELKTQREQAKRDFDTRMLPLSGERKALRENVDRAGAQLSLLRRQMAECESREPQLERELRDARKLQTELMSSDADTPEMRDRLGEVRERVTALPSQIVDVQKRRARTQVELEELQRKSAQESEREGALAKQQRELESAHTAEDRKLAEAISGKEREKEKTEEQYTNLEKAKTEPYREIGRVLADSHLPPMNQPQALDTVRECRRRVQEIEYAIAKSRQDSAGEDRALVQSSLIVLSAVAIALLLVIGALIEW